jgi:pyoverdine/dityrosine biosynthesis protein Dit1
MKKTLVLLFATILCTCSYAQSVEPSKYQKKQASKYTDELVKYLSDIVPEQEKSIYQLNLNISIQFDSLRKLKLETNEYKKAAREIFINKEKQLKKLLTINQFDEYAMMQDEKKAEYIKKKQDQQKIVADSIKVQ